MYLLFLDESGTHGGSQSFILGGIAIHEQDAFKLQSSLESELRAALGDDTDTSELELHGNELRNPKARKSNWFGYPYDLRFEVLDRAIRVLSEFQPTVPQKGPALFGAVIERTFLNYEERAYEELLHRFQSMLTRRGYVSNEPLHERGLVIHDRRVVEHDIQSQTQMWRRAKGRIPRRLEYLADVPLFADSKASRLIQAADLVCYAMWRYYGLKHPDDRYIKSLWSRFDQKGDGVIDGLTHVWPGFDRGDPCCPPCQSRR